MAASKIPSSVGADTPAPRLTPTDRLQAAHEENIRLATENAAYRERERIAAETPRPIPVETVRPQPIPVAAPAAAAVPPIRPIRPVFNDERDRRILWRIVAALLVVALIATGLYYYRNYMGPFSGSWTLPGLPAATCCQTTPPTPPATVVVETPAPAGTCDLKCLQATVEATCPGTSFKYEGAIVNGMNAEQVIALLKESKNCPVVTPIKVDVPEPRYIKVWEPKPHKKVVVRRPPPVEVADTPTTCSLWVQTWEQIGTGVPRTNTVRVWIDGRKVAGPISVRGDGYVRVPCSVVYGHNGKICFGFGPGSESELVDAAWLANARREVENGSSVINPNRPIRWAAYGPNGE